jgi:hypothetical protein
MPGIFSKYFRSLFSSTGEIEDKIRNWNKLAMARIPLYYRKNGHSMKQASQQANCGKHEGLLHDMYFEVANLRLGRSSDKLHE